MKNNIAQKYAGMLRLLSTALLLGFMQFSFAQETSLDNFTGNWTTDGTWVSGTAPGTVGLNVDVNIYGYVVRYGDLDFNNGDLAVYDTLVMYGSLDLGNNADLTLGSSAILIIHGDYISGNQVQVANGGAMVVTGNWEMLGSDNQGAFDNDGQLYILDPDPDLKTGSGYGDFTCDDPVDSCQQYGYDDLINSGIGDFFVGGTHQIDTSGVTNFCPGGSVTLSVTDTASNYQWFKDSISIGGATTFSYVVTTTGKYYVEFDLIDARLTLSQIEVTVDTLSPQISSCATDKIVSANASCQGAIPDLTGEVIATDNCDASLTITQSPVAGTLVGLGITTVMITVTDDVSKTATCSADVTVIDDTPPSITAPADISVNNDPGVCTASGVVLGSPTTADNCGVASTVNDAPAVFPLGATIVTWTVTDNAGLTNTATHSVTVIDNTVPTITAPADVVVNNDPGVCTASAVVLGAAITDDNCGVASTVNDAPASFPVGATIVTWTVSDDAGLTASASQTVTVIDNEDPTVTAPADVIVNSSLGLCTASGVVLGVPATADNCNVASTVNDAPAVFPLGATTVTWTVTDDAGLTATSTQTVTVIDNEDPTIAAPADVIVNNDIGVCTVTGLALGSPTVADNCGVASTVNDAPATFLLGATTVTWTVTDDAGLTASTTQTVTVIDNEDPTITAPADVVINNDPGICTSSAVILGAAITADNCGVAGTVNDAPAIFPVGATTVTWTVTDDAGLTASATQTVTVIDNEDPTITAPADVIVNSSLGLCTASGIVLGVPATADNCNVASTVNDAPAVFPLGATTVTWTVTDDAGLTATSTQTVTVIDNEDPTITSPADLIVNNDIGVCTASGVALGVPVTGDNCGVAGTMNDAPATFPLGATTVTWTVTDDAGLTATSTQIVTIIDSENPTITAPADVMVNNDPGVCSASGVVLGSALTADNCGVAGTVNDAPVAFTLGATTVTWTVTDDAGLTATATQTVTVIDSENPTITAPTDVIVNNDVGVCTASGVLLGAAATSDNCGIASIVNDAPAVYPLGATNITWTVTDDAGLTATSTQTVTVIDNEDPTITSPADLIVNNDIGVCTASGVALGVPVTGDNCGVAGTMNDAPATFPLGATTVTWTVTDDAGLTASATQIVTVIDNENPTITAPADVVVNNDVGVCTATGVALGVPIVADNCGVAGTVNDAPATFALGATTVTWTVTDDAGLKASASQTVTVVDNENPTITAPPDVSVNNDVGVCTASGVLLGVAATSDNCGIASTVNDAPAVFPLGATIVTWTVTDDAGLTATSTQTVTVLDNEDPTITAPADVIANNDAGVCTASGVVLGAPVNGDNCGVAGITNDAPAIFPLGATTVTWTVTDDAGLTATSTQIVTIIDSENPTITAPADVMVNNDPGVCTASGVVLGVPSTADNCGVAGTVNDAPAVFPLGASIVTWTVTDDAGLTATSAQTVTVADNDVPTITAPVDLIVNNDIGVCTASGVALGLPTTADNCGVASTVNDAPAIFPEGVTTVIWTVTDNAGHTATATQLVTVVETEDPVITACPANITIPADDEYCGSIVTWSAPTASDNCSVTLTSSHDPGDFFLIGTTTVTYTATDGSGNSVLCSFDVTVDAPAPIVISGEMNACSLGEETYTLPVLIGKTYSWTSSEGSIVGSTTDESVVVNWTSVLDGTVSVAVTSGSGCTANGSLTVSKIAGPATSEIRSEANPNSLPGYLSETCAGDSGLYYAVSGSAGSTFLWSIEGGSIARNFEDSVIVDWGLLPGEYEISVVETGLNTCIGETKTGTILISTMDFELGNDTAICEGELFSLTPAGEYQSISWNDGSTGVPYEAFVEGLISCTVVNGGCSVSDELFLTVNVSPNVDLGRDTAICGELILDAGEDGIIFDWSTGEVSREIEVSGSQQEISIEVENEYGCIDRDTINIDICDLNDYFSDIDNTITPNGDGKNDIWIVDKLAGFPDVVVEIYDRWGRLVYESEAGYQTPWDGTNMNGDLVPTGSYQFVFMLNYGDFRRVSGFVMVIN